MLACGTELRLLHPQTAAFKGHRPGGFAAPLDGTHLVSDVDICSYFYIWPRSGLIAKTSRKKATAGLMGTYWRGSFHGTSSCPSLFRIESVTVRHGNEKQVLLLKKRVG